MLAAAPADEFIFFADPLSAERLPLEAPNARLVRVEQRESPAVAAASDGSRSLGDMLRFSRAVARERPDVFFFPSVYSFFPLPPGQRAVVTVHDAIAERYPELTLPSAKARLFWMAKVRAAEDHECPYRSTHAGAYDGLDVWSSRLQPLGSSRHLLPRATTGLLGRGVQLCLRRHGSL